MVEYEETMKNSLTKSFNETYENIIDGYENKFRLEDSLKALLKQKRQKGFEKYGEYSFQSSFAKSLDSPTLQHCKEEIFDAINYLFHELFKANIFNKRDKADDISLIIGDILDLLNQIEDIEGMGK